MNLTAPFRPAIWLLALIFVLSACGPSEEPGENSTQEGPRFITFSIKAEQNAGVIKKSIVASIDEETIAFVVSDGVDATNLIADFEFEGERVLVGDEEQESGVTANDFTAPLRYRVVAQDGTEASYQVNILFLDELQDGVPHFYIETEEWRAIDTKEEYIQAELRIDGDGVYEDFEGSMRIRGRGNSTWAMPKKPYRIKLDSKASILGLAAEKDWVLLANWLDGTLMANAIAFKAGRLLEMPFTHHIIPVEVTVNGEYLGNYMLTEHKEVGKDRINIGDEGVLLELDTNFDEAFQFKSAIYSLPTMIQYPELEDEEDEAIALLKMAEIQSDFEEFEALIAADTFPENGYRELFGLRDLAQYLIVYYISANQELNHPKSVYLYRKAGEPYRMGPIWDFDWAYGYNQTDDDHFIHPQSPLFWDGSSARAGTRFFTRFLEDPEFVEILQLEWEQFKADLYPVLMDYIQGYAEVIRESYSRDHGVWGRGRNDLGLELERMAAWFEKHVEKVDDLASALVP